MAYKRSRAAFESDLQAQESPFVFYGTPLPPLDSEARDDGSYLPAWKQTATDEQGRKRFHGAFTGGYSAGYFNTVGSKEGWTPSTFVSSRSNRHKTQTDAAKKGPEDYMDDEDRADAAEARQLTTTQAFASLGDTEAGRDKYDPFFGLVTSGGDTMGIKLLQKMGWRHGQGIGPKVRRKARLDEEDAATVETPACTEHLLGPDNSRIISFARKDDRKGLGFAGEVGLMKKVKLENSIDAQPQNDDPFESAKARKKKQAQKAPQKRTGFGVGILNDEGSDDEDPYEMGPRISYNKVIGAEKKAKMSAPLKSSSNSANPLLSTRPIFVSKKGLKRNVNANFRACHDGRFPLDGFVLSSPSSALKDQLAFPPPKVPQGWKSAKCSNTTESSGAAFQSVTDAAKASTMDSKSRASLLGEASLPGKSVFDYLSKDARDRLASASGKSNLPQGRGEAPPEAYRKTAAENQKDLRSLVPFLSKDIAIAALNKGKSGWMPYAEDLGKRARYTSFLELRAEQTEALPERAPQMSVADWIKELGEFVHAAQVFKPVSGLMASRFTSSNSQLQPAEKSTNDDSLLRGPDAKPQDPAEQAAKMGMYGPMTRSTVAFMPTRLLCKRFNVRPPPDTEPDLEAGAAPSDSMPAQSRAQTLALVSQSTIDEMMKESPINVPKADVSNGPQASSDVPQRAQAAIVDVETNHALEGERPGADVFRAIFGSDDED